MAVELWNDVGTRLGLTSQFIEYQNYADLVKAVSANEVDAAVTNLTITEKRAEVVDFTHPGSTQACALWCIRRLAMDGTI